MSTVRSITADCQTEDGTEVTLETTQDVEGALMVVQIAGSNKRVYLSADDLQMVTEFIHREVQRAEPLSPF